MINLNWILNYIKKKLIKNLYLETILFKIDLNLAGHYNYNYWSIGNGTDYVHFINSNVSKSVHLDWFSILCLKSQIVELFEWFVIKYLKVFIEPFKWNF